MIVPSGYVEVIDKYDRHILINKVAINTIIEKSDCMFILNIRDSDEPIVVYEYCEDFLKRLNENV